MAFTLTTPITLVSPEIPYDKFGIHLNLGTVWEVKNVEGNVAFSLIPYRYLPDGTVDHRDDLRRDFSLSRVFELSATDSDVALCMSRIMGAIQDYVTVKGLY